MPEGRGHGFRICHFIPERSVGRSSGPLFGKPRRVHPVIRVGFAASLEILRGEIYQIPKNQALIDAPQITSCDPPPAHQL